MKKILFQNSTFKYIRKYFNIRMEGSIYMSYMEEYKKWCEGNEFDEETKREL